MAFYIVCTLYYSSTVPPGDLAILGGVTLTLESNALLTFTCISIGGSATNVTWTRDSVTVTEGTETVLDDQVTAQYTHTLTVTETTSFNGTYSCEIFNDKPSWVSVTMKTTVLYTGYGNLKLQYGHCIISL